MNDMIDKRLRNYFQSEVPRSFPACPVEPIGLSTASTGLRNRTWQTTAMATAAGVILVFALIITPTSNTKSTSNEDPFTSATADGKTLKTKKQ
jgi:hypothetical protein